MKLITYSGFPEPLPKFRSVATPTGTVSDARHASHTSHGHKRRSRVVKFSACALLRLQTSRLLISLPSVSRNSGCASIHDRGARNMWRKVWSSTANCISYGGFLNRATIILTYRLCRAAQSHTRDVSCRTAEDVLRGPAEPGL